MARRSSQASSTPAFVFLTSLGERGARCLAAEGVTVVSVDVSMSPQCHHQISRATRCRYRQLFNDYTGALCVHGSGSMCLSEFNRSLCYCKFVKKLSSQNRNHNQ